MKEETLEASIAMVRDIVIIAKEHFIDKTDVRDDLDMWDYIDDAISEMESWKQELKNRNFGRK